MQSLDRGQWSISGTHVREGLESPDGDVCTRRKPGPPLVARFGRDEPGDRGNGAFETNDDRAADARSPYDKLERALLPLFDGRRDGCIDAVRHAIALNGSFFATERARARAGRAQGMLRMKQPRAG